MFRVRGAHDNKEYLYFEAEWFGKNWRGLDIPPVTHICGKYRVITKTLKYGDFDRTTGEQDIYYVKGPLQDVYDIPFNKTNVDKYLKSEHPFGPDSENITDVNKVKFYGKITDVLGISSFRCGDYTYEQFITHEWKNFVNLATQKGGPQKRAGVLEQTTTQPHIA